MKNKTIRMGEEAVIFNHLGEGRLVKGPDRMFLFRERLQMLQIYTATQYQYLVVKYNDGHLQHVSGPCSMFCNPLEHTSISKREAEKIDANHMIVVYHTMKDGTVERRIVVGPTLFVAKAEEWLHEFVWHGRDPADRTHMKPGLNKFTQLTSIPDYFDYIVRDVRTTDDTILTVKLMIFYEMKDVIKMLEMTHDPIADLLNAVCADVIAFAGKITFQGFLEQTQKLSELENYQQLLQRAQRMGFSINKVVYRGYHASDQLQAMQDSAIKSRTELRLDAELADQRQKLTDFKLKRQHQRAQLEHEMEQKKAEHRQQMELLKTDHTQQLRQMEHVVNLQCERQVQDAKLEHARVKAEEKVTHLQNLGALDVDLTRYLATQGPVPVQNELRVSSNTSV